jgi:hypothetical protein
MTPRITYLTVLAGLALALAAVPTAWGDGQRQAPVTPAVVDPAVTAHPQRETTAGTYRDAFERTVADPSEQSPLGSYRDAGQRSGARDVAGSTVDRYPDAVHRAVQQHVQSGALPGHADRYEISLPNAPIAAPTTSPGLDIEWPQLGIGFAVGLLLASGLFLAARIIRIRPLAH